MTTQIVVNDLVAEFQHAGLIDTDARRSAFCALAHNSGWSTVRIGRYLGVTRQRAVQRIDRLRKYADTRGDMPLLCDLLETAVRPEANGATDLPVAFLAAAWDDPIFALGMLSQLAA